MPGLESGRSLDIRSTAGYQQEYNRIHQSFERIIFSACDQEYEPIGLEGYSLRQEQMAVLSLGLVISPDILSLSHCPHRTVAACVVQQFEEKLEGERAAQALQFVKNFGVLGSILVTDEGSFLLLVGCNNWWSKQSRAEKLNCKLFPGSPLEVPRDYLVHLSPDQPMDNYSHVDNACAKRVSGADCQIIHAETEVFVLGTLFKHFNMLPPVKKVFLSSTWVPCLQCLLKIKMFGQRLYGQEVDVFSVYEAEDDFEDRAVAKGIEFVVQAGNLGYFSGPWTLIPKRPGYGWMPYLLDDMLGNLKSPSDDSPDVAKRQVLIERARELAQAGRNS